MSIYKVNDAAVWFAAVWFVAFWCGAMASAQVPADLSAKQGKLLYQSAMDSKESVQGWVMEGPGTVEFADGWMSMKSPGEKMHHVFWCPEIFPESFVAQWEMQNQHLEAGLCIVFFAATGLKGEDVLDPSLPKRDGTFKQYNKGGLKNYHISYYANTPNKPNRKMSHLRKNPGANMVSEGMRGIEVTSSAVHQITLLKEGPRIRLYVDQRSIIDWTDDGTMNGEPRGAGKFALRQMQWTQFRYRNFKVWEVK
ncbi:MAG: LuxR family transcriptional regulator [Blastopirellula sp.]|nr:MAG: LuxR family transcriptional regulator [Blastopirellula sp.]